MTAALAKLMLCYLVNCTAQERALIAQEFRDARHAFCEKHLIANDPYDDGSDE
jgi:hypothetical protein